MKHVIWMEWNVLYTMKHVFVDGVERTVDHEACVVDGVDCTVDNVLCMVWTVDNEVCVVYGVDCRQ